MKILFIENRYKTYFYDALAALLEKSGHEIYWIIQNHSFKPKNGTSFKIPYPKKDISFNSNVNLDDIIASDRQVNFFGLKRHQHFFYYYDKIAEIFNKLKPDVVFGESTLFHELIAIKICKERDIMFLHPTSCRYPKNRFSFYKYDTVEPFYGSNETLPINKANHIIDSIANRKVKPNYMKKVKKDYSKLTRDKFKILRSRLEGERYNTPSATKKYKLEKDKNKNIVAWNKLAIQSISNDDFSVLYPLHLQPEANIDVWGRPKRNQLSNVKSIANRLKGSQMLYVKPNPKSKYELSEAFISFCNEHAHIKMLHHNVSMDAIFKSIDLFITVNGTIALECIFSNKPVLSLIETMYNEAPNCVFLEDDDKIPYFIEKVKTGSFNSIKQKEQLDFINLLSKTSYSGIISDPFYDENCISQKNLSNVENAFNDVLSKIL